MKRLITRCFEPDSMDLIKPLAVDERDGDDDDDDDDDVDITLLTIPTQYRHIDLCNYLKDRNNRTIENYTLILYEKFRRGVIGGSTKE